MPLKWDLPPVAPPFWLDPHAELLTAPEPMSRADFVLKCVDEVHRALPDTGPVQRFQVVANAIIETGWGAHRKGNNLGGWKINKHRAGPGVRWFRARGNKAPGATLDDFKGGDPPWCYYLAFASFGAYFAAWVANFVPKRGTGRYAKCGQQFWAGEPWFDDLIEAGYKGENTRAHPWKSIDDLNSLAKEVATFWAQREVGVHPDGEWGRLSREAALVWAGKRGVTIEGTLDSVLSVLLPHRVSMPSRAAPRKIEQPKVKPAEVKPAEVKPAEVKPAEVKPAEVKPAEVKPETPVAG